MKLKEIEEQLGLLFGNRPFEIGCAMIFIENYGIQMHDAALDKAAELVLDQYRQGLEQGTTTFTRYTPEHKKSILNLKIGKK